jgi:mono/diheme cytochrome c family protein
MGQAVMRISIRICFALSLLGGAGTAFAQDIENGQRLSERWCTECHDIGPAPGKFRGAPSFASIAGGNVSADMIASFLLLPHATMPNPPLNGRDAWDIAAFITRTKNK